MWWRWAAAARRLLGRRRRVRPAWPPLRESSSVAQRVGDARGRRRGGVECGQAHPASTLARPASRRCRGLPWRRRPAPRVAAGSAAGAPAANARAGSRWAVAAVDVGGARARAEGHCWSSSVPTRIGLRRTALRSLVGRGALRSTNWSSMRTRRERCTGCRQRAHARILHARLRCPSCAPGSPGMTRGGGRVGVVG